MSKNTLVLPPELVAKIKSGLSGYRNSIAQLRAVNDLDRRILDIFDGMITGAESDPTLQHPLTALKGIILDGSSIPDALARLAAFDRPDLPPEPQTETPAYVHDIIKALKELRAEVFDLSGRTHALEKILLPLGLGQNEVEVPRNDPVTQTSNNDRVERVEPTQLGLDLAAARDFVSAQPAVAYEGGGATKHTQNEDVIGIPISEREHINGLVAAVTTLAQAQKRPLLIGEIKAEMLRTGAPFGKMSGTWVNSTLAQNFIRWGDPKRRGGGWWPVTLHLGEVDYHLYQQATLPLNDKEAKAATTVTDAYNARRVSQNLPPLEVHKRSRRKA